MSVRVEIVHLLPRRARLRIHNLIGARMPSLASWLCARRGVREARASSVTCTVCIELDAGVVNLDALLRAIESEALSAWPVVQPSPTEPKRFAWGGALYNTLLLAAAASGAVSSLVTGAGIAVAIVPSVRRTRLALRERRLSVDVLDVAAVGVATALGQHATAAFITWLLSLGDAVLALTERRARSAIAELLEPKVRAVWRLHAGKLEQVSIEGIVPGDSILVSAGGGVPVDGKIVQGVAVVDTKALTGESIPKRRGVGHRLLSSSVIVEGEVLIKVQRVKADTSAARIVQILTGSADKAVSLQREIEARADWLVLPTCAVASAAGLLSGSLDRSTSVLITDFGTGVRIAIPTCALASMTGAAREGILIKGGRYLERLAKTDTIVFDKTGTLTHGETRIIAVHALGELPEARVLQLAAAVERRQRHPLARAIVAAARARGQLDERLTSAVHELTYDIGTGLRARVDGQRVVVGGERLLRCDQISLEAARPLVAQLQRQGHSPVFVAVDGELAGVLACADEARDESRHVVRALRAKGRRRIMLLSGDARAPVDAIARRLGVDEAHAELLPEQKAELIRSLQSQGRVVSMIGDGINDAPALALADVGISLGCGTDVAIETADVVLLGGGLERLPRTFALADDGMRRIHRGVGLVIAPNAVAMLLGALGLLSPAAAATINNGSTVLAALSGLTPLWSRAR